MLLRFITLFLYSLVSFESIADTNTELNQDNRYIDRTYEGISKYIVDFSEAIDTTLSGFLEKSDENSTIKLNKKESVDAFFQNNKFLNETQETYISIRLNSLLESKEKNSFNYTVNAQIPLSRSQKNLNLFIDNTADKVIKNITPEETEDVSSPEVGVNYFAPSFYGIKSKYLVGAGGINLFARARYSIKFEPGEWTIEPVQTFMYSSIDRFEEQSNIYFDTQVLKETLFRVMLHRKTETNMDGMDYALAVQYYWSPQKNTVLNITQSFSGNTEYKYIADKSTIPQKRETYRGISNYATIISWRESIWKKWFFYELRPGISFHKIYDYDANYTFNFLVDFYFGKLD